MMIDLESVYADLCEYLGGERVQTNEPRDPIDMPVFDNNRDENSNAEGGEEEPMEEDPHDGGDDPNGDEIVHMALNGIPLNGQTIDRTDVHPEVHPADHGEDVDMGTETAEERRRRYVSSSQDEVSNPDEWADVQFGHLDSDAYERMLAYSRANRIRLQRAAATLNRRHDEAATVGNWEEAALMLRALHEVEALMDITWGNQCMRC